MIIFNLFARIIDALLFDCLGRGGGSGGSLVKLMMARANGSEN